VRRKTAFLLNTLLLSPATTITTTTTTTTTGGDASPSGTTTAIRGGGTDPDAGAGGARVHPNSHAALVADPRSADTAPATLRALRAHGLLPALVRELTVPTPHGPDGEEGGACDADFEEKLARCDKPPHSRPSVRTTSSAFARLLHTYVAVHSGKFDVPERQALKVFLDMKRAGQSEGGGELGLGADELRALESVLA